LAAVLLFIALILDGLVFGEPSVHSTRFLLLYMIGMSLSGACLLLAGGMLGMRSHKPMARTRCAKCDYMLRALAETTADCPECGEALPGPDTPMLWRTRPWLLLCSVLMVLAGLAILALSAFILLVLVPAAGA
jgi:hypothetical protein